VETLEPLLKEHPFFRDLAPGVIQLLTGCAKNVRLEAGQVIFREGEDADQFYLIRDGRVALEVFTSRGPAPDHDNQRWRSARLVVADSAV
jgi:CRP/FNR family transcriptional regulator, cyclic AMP receptor protein